MVKKTVHLEPDAAAALERLAVESGRNVDDLLREAVERLLREGPATTLTARGHEQAQSLFGALAAYGPAPSAEEVAEARREAWAVFPRPAPIRGTHA